MIMVFIYRRAHIDKVAEGLNIAHPSKQPFLTIAN